MKFYVGRHYMDFTWASFSKKEYIPVQLIILFKTLLKNLPEVPVHLLDFMQNNHGKMRSTQRLLVQSLNLAKLHVGSMELKIRMIFQ